MANEEIVVNMGLNHAAFSAGLVKSQQIAKTAGEEIKKTMVDSLKGIFAPLIGLFALNEVKEGILSTLEWAKGIKRAADDLGTTTGFVQGLESASNKLNISFEDTSRAVEILSKKIGEARNGAEGSIDIFKQWGIAIDGKTTEEVFYEISNRLHDMQDPAERNALAFDLMGKGARDLGSALAIGAPALQAMIDGADKLSDESIAKLEHADAVLEEFARKWKLLKADVVSEFLPGILPEGVNETALRKRIAEIQAKDKPFFGKKTINPLEGGGVAADQLENYFGAYYTQAVNEQLATIKKGVAEQQKGQAQITKEKRDQAEYDKLQSDLLKKRMENSTLELSPILKISALMKEQKDLAVSMIFDQAHRIDNVKKLIQIEDIEKEIAKARVEHERQSEESLKRQQTIKRETASMQKEYDTLERQKKHEEFTEGERGSVYPTIQELANTRGPFNWVASAILRDNLDQRNARIKGNIDRADWDRRDANSRMDYLAEQGVIDPTEYEHHKADIAAQDTADAIKELLAKAKAEGIKIQPVMAP